MSKFDRDSYHTPPGFGLLVQTYAYGQGRFPNPDMQPLWVERFVKYETGWGVTGVLNYRIKMTRVVERCYPANLDEMWGDPS